MSTCGTGNNEACGTRALCTETGGAWAAKCRRCPEGTQRPFYDEGDVKSVVCTYQGSEDDNTSGENGKVCITTYHAETFDGDPVTGAATTCDECAGGYRIVIPARCQRCDVGYWRPAGDSLIGASDITQCHVCAANYYVSGGACTACDVGAGFGRPRGDPTRVACTHTEECLYFGGNAKERTDANEQTLACTDGFCTTGGAAANLVKAPDTQCVPIMCKANEHVVDHQCQACDEETFGNECSVNTCGAGSDACTTKTLCKDAGGDWTTTFHHCSVDTSCGAGAGLEPCAEETCGKCSVSTCGAEDDAACTTQALCEAEGTCDVSTCGAGSDPCTTQALCEAQTNGDWTGVGVWASGWAERDMWDATTMTIQTGHYWIKKGEKGCGYPASSTFMFDSSKCPDQCAAAVPHLNENGEVERITVTAAGTYYEEPGATFVYHQAGDMSTREDTDCMETTPAPTVFYITHAPSETPDKNAALVIIMACFAGVFGLGIIHYLLDERKAKMKKKAHLRKAMSRIQMKRRMSRMIEHHAVADA